MNCFATHTLQKCASNGQNRLIAGLRSLIMPKESILRFYIHRNYFDLGSEVHIDIYDNRLSIWSAGGMINGRFFKEQSIFRMESQRRNPIIADLFQRMKFMERRGSGFGKVIDATKSPPGYTDDFMSEF